MSLSERASIQKPRHLPETGLQPARCYAIIDLGTQSGFFKGQPKAPSAEIIIMWELTKFMKTFKEGTPPVPATVSQKYSFSAGAKAKLPDVLKAWGKLTKRPEKIGVDLLKKYVGAPCMLTIEHTADGQYANVGSGGRAVNPFMSEFPVPVKHNTPIFFDLDNFTWDVFKTLPKFVHDLILKSAAFPAISSKNPEPVSVESIQVDTDEVDPF